MGNGGSESAVEFSAVISCYREEQSLREFHRRLSDTLAALGRSFEIVYVNDGSRDGTLAVLREIYEADANVGVLIDLLRNFGSAAAVAAGCAAARGRHFIFLDSDLQLDPEDLPSLIREFDRSVDLVNGVRQSRRDTLARTIASRLFNRILLWFSGAQLQDPFCTFKVARGELVRGLEPGPYRVMNPVQLAAAAGACADVPVAHHPRPYGHSNWKVSGLVALGLDTILGLARYPFQVFLLLGTVAGALGLALSLFLRYASPWPGWGAMLLIILSGINVGALFLVSEYLVRLHRAQQGPPRYIVRSVWSRPAKMS